MLVIDLVRPGVYRGAQPLKPEHWAQLHALGIKFILDLETGSHILFDGSPLLEQVTAQMYDIRTYAHPLGEVFPPTKDERDIALAIAVNYSPLYIHCKAGVDRTGMICARIRMFDGWPKAKAIKEMRELGMHWWYYWWGWFL